MTTRAVSREANGKLDVSEGRAGFDSLMAGDTNERSSGHASHSQWDSGSAGTPAGAPGPSRSLKVAWRKVSP